MQKMGECGDTQYYDVPAGRCAECDDICLPKYGTPKQCARLCYDFLLKRAYQTVEPSSTPPPLMDTGFYSYQFILIIVAVLLVAIVVTAVISISAERSYKISEKLPCCRRAKLGGMQPLDQADRLTRDAEVAPA